jgi:hypothetical protein
MLRSPYGRRRSPAAGPQLIHPGEQAREIDPFMHQRPHLVADRPGCLGCVPLIQACRWITSLEGGEQPVCQIRHHLPA